MSTLCVCYVNYNKQVLLLFLFFCLILLCFALLGYLSGYNWQQTNLYITQTSVSNCPSVNTAEIRQFLYIASYLYLCTTIQRLNPTGVNMAPIMYNRQWRQIDRVEKIRSLIHFSDNAKRKPVGHSNHDRFHKIRSVVEHLNKLFVNVTSFDQRHSLSLDERTLSTNVAHFMKQYLPKKPHKWGFELFGSYSLSEYVFITDLWVSIGSESIGINSWVLYTKNHPSLTLNDYRLEPGKTL